MSEDADAPVVIWSTWPDEVSAAAAARALVEDRLAACVLRWPDVTAVYRWRGAVEEGREIAMLIKTRASRVEAVFAAVAARHPYEVPALIALPIAAAAASYGAWILAETAPVAPTD